jgi:hypothetical protein
MANMAALSGIPGRELPRQNKSVYTIGLAGTDSPLRTATFPAKAPQAG